MPLLLGYIKRVLFEAFFNKDHFMGWMNIFKINVNVLNDFMVNIKDILRILSLSISYLP